MYTYIPTIKIQFEIHRKNRLEIGLAIQYEISYKEEKS